MKKLVKVLKGIVKGYFIFDLICWSIVGIGEIVNAIVTHPNDSIIDCDYAVFKDALRKIKKVFGRD